MDSKTYDQIFVLWKDRKPNEVLWTESLAKQFGYSSSEAIRSAFRRHKNRTSVFTERKNNSSAKILLFDIETTPINALVWGIWEQNVSIPAILQDWHLLSWSAKWLFDDVEMSDILTSKEARAHDDKRICESIWKLIDDADIVVAHNGNKFDNKKLATRFLYHEMPPPSHYRSVDTLVVAKEIFSFTSNKLDYINAFLGIPGKQDVDFEVWKDAYFGKQYALDKMREYNKNDTYILEELFLKMRPYIKNFPNLNLFVDENVSVCRNCASKDILWSGYYYTNISRYKGWRCNDCGAIGRSRFPDTNKEKKKTVIV